MQFNISADIKTKLGSAGLAVLLWFHVSSQAVIQYDREIPVRIKGIPEGLVIANDIPR